MINSNIAFFLIMLTHGGWQTIAEFQSANECELYKEKYLQQKFQSKCIIKSDSNQDIFRPKSYRKTSG